jgi:hypothetical protein
MQLPPRRRLPRPRVPPAHALVLALAVGTLTAVALVAVADAATIELSGTRTVVDENARPSTVHDRLVRGSRQSTQPRIDAMGVHPAEHPVAGSRVPVVPVSRATHASGGGWLPIAIGSSVMVALLLAAGFLPTRWFRAHTFRARQV